MGFEGFEPMIGEPKPEWWKSSVSGSPPPCRFMMHVYAPDYYHLKIQVTDFHSNTFETVKSVDQLEDLRDSMGIGGSWSDFVDYLIASVKSDNVKLVLEKYSDSDDAANAKFFAQKSNGMPLIHISLGKLQNTVARDAMSEISFGLFNANKSMQSSVSQEEEHLLQLTPLLSAEKEKGENIQSQLGKRLKSSDKEDVSASLASNGLQGSPEPNQEVRILIYHKSRMKKLKININRGVWRMTKGSQKRGLKFQVIQLSAIVKAIDNFGKELLNITTNIEDLLRREKQALARTMSFGCYV